MIALVRYGAIPEVARFRSDLAESLGRGAPVVVQSPRGIQVGMFLNTDPGAELETDLEILRQATNDDLQSDATHRRQCGTEFSEWQARIEKWNLKLELLDLEWTLDHTKLILYVLNDRGPDCTQLALQAAAAGLGIIEVQPVDSNGPVAIETQGGCGSCSNSGH